MYAISQPLASICRVRNDCAIKSNAAKPSSAVTSVYGEHAHGLRNRCRHLLSWASIVLSNVMFFVCVTVAGPEVLTVQILGGRRCFERRCVAMRTLLRFPTCRDHPTLYSHFCAVNLVIEYVIVLDG